MSSHDWRRIRNVPLVVALIVNSVQLWIIFPTLQGLVSELQDLINQPVGGNIQPPIDDPAFESRIWRAMLLQIIGLPAWITAFVGWRMARSVAETEKNE